MLYWVKEGIQVMKFSFEGRFNNVQKYTLID